jgi:hypothetical protein
VRDGGFANGRVIGGRCDAPMGEGILVGGHGNTFTGIDNSSSCSGFGSVPRGTVFGPYIATLGSGMTNGSYVVPANAGFGGTGATLTVVVSGGKASTIAVSAPGSAYTSTPTFTMTGTGGTPATIGATTYQHCDYLDDEGGNNSYVNVVNLYESFFGPDFSTGSIWLSGNSGSTFDRGTTGTFERVVAGVNTPTGSIPKGRGAHKDTSDLFAELGGTPVTGPAVSFTGGNHFSSADASATSWTGPFTVDNVMQDIWIMGGTPNTTLPVSAGWQTCSGHDLNLGPARWYHFQVFQDDVFFTVGTNFIFREQCDTIEQDFWQVNFAGQTPPSTPTLAATDTFGSYVVRPLAALSAGSLTSAGATTAFTYCFITEVWVAGGKQTNAPVCSSKPPVVTTSLDNLFYQQTMPQDWTRYRLIFQSTTDSAFTALVGTILDVTASNHTPQPSLFVRFGVQPASLSADGAVIVTANQSLNMTGTYNASIGGVSVPASSGTLCTQGQQIHSCSAGFDYTCTTEDHWVRNAITCSTF